MAKVSIGTRDYCRHCGGVIEYATAEARGSRQWEHVTDLGPVRLCPGLEVLYENHKYVDPELVGEVNTFASPKAMPKSYCMESMQTRSWYSPYCLRPIKDEKLMMCGIHASHVRKADKKRIEEEQAQEQAQYLAEVIEQVIRHIHQEYGLKAQIEYSRWTGYGAWFPPTPTGNIAVDPQKLLETLDGLRDEESF